jgi:hypothetical protein
MLLIISYCALLHCTILSTSAHKGSSSTAPIYNINSDVSLAAYKQIAKGSCFSHPISGELLKDYATHYVDDKTEMVNKMGMHDHMKPSSDSHQDLFEAANANTTAWNQILWVSGGSLNTSKCFYCFL